MALNKIINKIHILSLMMLVGFLCQCTAGQGPIDLDGLDGLGGSLAAPGEGTTGTTVPGEVVAVPGAQPTEPFIPSGDIIQAAVQVHPYGITVSPDCDSEDTDNAPFLAPYPTIRFYQTPQGKVILNPEFYETQTDACGRADFGFRDIENPQCQWVVGYTEEEDHYQANTGNINCSDHGGDYKIEIEIEVTPRDEPLGPAVSAPTEFYGD